MDRMSVRGRIVREPDEAPLSENEKKPTRSRAGSSMAPVRVKVIWEVCNGTGKSIRTFPYPEKAAAEAQTRALTWSTGRPHMLRATKVPME